MRQIEEQQLPFPAFTRALSVGRISVGLIVIGPGIGSKERQTEQRTCGAHLLDEVAARKVFDRSTCFLRPRPARSPLSPALQLLFDGFAGEALLFVSFLAHISLQSNRGPMLIRPCER